MNLPRIVMNPNPQAESPFNGLLLVDKPYGYTSHDVVADVRYALKIKKVGHAGTLDPMATGLLIIMLGKATRLFDQLSGSNKTYEGMFTLGVKTDSGDLDGRIESLIEPPQVSREQIDTAFERFSGTYMQTVPSYSAVKIKGKKAYAMARQGLEFKRPSRSVKIKDFECLNIHEDDIWFRVHVSTGTYVRALVEDVAKELGTIATLSSLRRIDIGDKKIERALTVQDVKRMSQAEVLAHMIPISEALPQPKNDFAFQPAGTQ
ncbi:MAG: tRNA pseudouridine55 synthase [Candidatus Omnitrophota bacterium]|jgi:tRNA pseudouridine55 synthase